MKGTLADLRRFLPELTAQGSSMAAEIADAVRAYAPVGKGSSRTAGTFAASLTGRSEGTSSGIVITVESDDEPVAGIIVHGSAPHEIVVRNAGSLRWESDGGGVRFAKRVLHPGTSPNDFAEQAESAIVAVVEETIDRAVQAVSA